MFWVGYRQKYQLPKTQWCLPFFLSTIQMTNTSDNPSPCLSVQSAGMLCLFLLQLFLRCSQVCEFVYSTGIAMGGGGRHVYIFFSLHAVPESGGPGLSQDCSL